MRVYIVLALAGAAIALSNCRGPCAGCMYPLAVLLPSPAPAPDSGVVSMVDAGPFDGGPADPVPDGGWPEVDDAARP